ncbi:zinc metallopeptidase [Sanyastnella coralliicola]|uniref:zinc metallopeptidase n=1 Tax=Sanyastnella coralliicola TaxID=3069118 RepID=UPI003D9C7839
MGLYLIGIVFAVISMFVSNRLKSKFRKYSQMPLASGMSGKEVAEKMLADNGIFDVKVISVAGQLTDHYNPMKKTVNLSEAVYMQRNAAAAAVAAHEVGHAVQHAYGYAWLQMRSRLVPIISVTSRFQNYVLLAGFILIGSFPSLLWIGIGMFAMTTLFSIITLPVEYDASNRALAWIDEKNIVTQTEYAASKDALKWAARTYLVSAIASIATLLYLIAAAMSRR